MTRPSQEELRARQAEYLAERRRKPAPEPLEKPDHGKCPGCQGNLTSLDVERGLCGSCAHAATLGQSAKGGELSRRGAPKAPEKAS